MIRIDYSQRWCHLLFYSYLPQVNGIDVSKYGHEKAAAALRDARDRVDLLLVYSPEGKISLYHSTSWAILGLLSTVYSNLT